MVEQKTCLILMPLGSEVRQFGHSGMITNLINKGWRVVAAVKYLDDDLRDQLDHRIEFTHLIQEMPSARYGRLHKVLDDAHQILELKQGKKQWKYHADRNRGFKQRVKSWILAQLAILVSLWPGLYSVLVKYEEHLSTEIISPAWIQLLKGFDVSVLVLNVLNIPSLFSALVTAKSQNIPRVLLLHTSKDVTVNGRLSHDYTAIGVWNKQMKQELLRQNRTLDAERITVVGCAHFDCVGQTDLLMSEQDFRQQIGARPNSNLILFPASAPWAVPDEGRYVSFLVEAIRTKKIDLNVQIIVRKNPMDQTTYWETEFAFCEHVRVSKSNWRWDARQNWCFQRRLDMILYNSLLHFSTVCVGIPSTVAIECAVSNLTVINIGFDLPGPLPLLGSIKAYWEADFYKDIVQNNLAVLANNEKQLISLIENTLNQENYLINDESSVSQILGVLPPNAAYKYQDVIEQVAK